MERAPSMDADGMDRAGGGGSAEGPIQRTRENAERVAVHIAQGPLGAARTVRGDELLGRGAALARRLAAEGVEPGDRVVVMLPTSAHFLFALYGTWLAGAAIVPVPHFSGLGTGLREARRITSALRTARPRAVVATRTTLALLQSQGLGELLRDLLLLLPEEIEELGSCDAQAPHEPEPGDLALVQLTSGSTGAPRGARIRHEQIVANSRGIGALARVGPEDAFVSWLPLHHDMGFMGLMSPILWGIPLHSQPTESFFRDPSSWLGTISSRRATLSPVPPFALDLLALRVSGRRVAELDLSCWRYAWIGAEPIFPSTFEAFEQRFAPSGLAETVLAPCYGMAEATLAVTLTSAGERWSALSVDGASLRARGEVREVQPGSAGSLRLMDCGQPMEGTRVELRDGTGALLDEGCEGEIHVAGPCISEGYLGEGQGLCDGWFDTGDLGFLRGGRLYVTGRKKDLIKRAGLTIHAHQVEEAAERAEGVRKGTAIALSCIDHASGRERVVLVSETRVAEPAEAERLRAAVRGEVLEQVGLQLDEVVLAAVGSTPKTTSGKRQRGLARERYEKGEVSLAGGVERRPEVQG